MSDGYTTYDPDDYDRGIDCTHYDRDDLMAEYRRGYRDAEEVINDLRAQIASLTSTIDYIMGG